MGLFTEEASAWDASVVRLRDAAGALTCAVVPEMSLCHCPLSLVSSVISSPIHLLTFKYVDARPSNL